MIDFNQVLTLYYKVIYYKKNIFFYNISTHKDRFSWIMSMTNI